jgi:hypothetical protein
MLSSVLLYARGRRARASKPATGFGALDAEDMVAGLETVD